ncbi:MAG: hypothetical protein AAF709_21580 [Pseudomonadota bacterium]
MPDGSSLYQRSMSYYEANERDGGILQHKVWDGTPWMVDVYTGRVADDRDLEIRDWCQKNFGEMAWPIHGRKGSWHRGGATVYGWTWFGFASEEMMNQFLSRWDDFPRDKKKPES